MGSKSFFEGWYIKLQAADGKAIALIPAVHRDTTGVKTASLQVITADKSWWLDVHISEYHRSNKLFHVRLGQNVFTERGIWMKVEEESLSLHGTVHFSQFEALKSDIMGPFRFMPHLECRHGVISMRHTLDGKLVLNGEIYDFSGGVGYIETDSGYSFPEEYLWTQCLWGKNSLMASIATVPTPFGEITGCICAIHYRGHRFRLATYRGAKVTKWSNNSAIIRQGKYLLSVEVFSAQSHDLRAPVQGCMSRTVREGLRATVRYQLWCGSELLFDRTDSAASFESAGSEVLS